MNKTFYWLCISLLFPALVFSQAANQHIRRGNAQYANNLYSNAVQDYEKAFVEEPASFEAVFNLGDALYRQGDFEQAAQKFNSLIQPNLDKQKLADVYYNLGNSYLQQFTQQSADEKMLTSALGAYKNALRNNPSDAQSRYNLMYAQELLKQLQQNQDQQNQDQQNQDQDQQNQDQQNQDQQNKGQDSDSDGIPDEVEKDGKDNQNPTDTDKDGKPDYLDEDSDNDGVPDKTEAGQNPQTPKDTDKDGVPDYRDLDSNNDGKPDSQDAQPKNPQQISQQDAERILKALEQNEAAMQQLMQQNQAQPIVIEKDW